jgi:outer membrane receptor for ferrienterochelin and colicin
VFVRKDTSGRRAWFLLNLLIMLSCTAPGIGQPQDSGTEDDFTDMSIEELMEIEIVVSGSRQAQKMNELSVPVSVITAEDIHYSGLTSIPEILQFSVGMDVLKLDRGRYAVGVRGMHDFTSDRLLTLINGRIADSPLFGGSEFWRLPILIEDIERIEVVRGPGGAAWGANAFTGVVNIITKKPEDVLGSLVTTNINEFGDTYTHLRFAEKQGKWTWRTSLGYEDRETSDAAGAGRFDTLASPPLPGLMGFGGYSTSDFSRNSIFDGEATYTRSAQTKMSVGAGYSHNELGNFEFGGYYPEGDGWLETVRPFAKIDHKFEDGSSGYVQWFGNFATSKIASLTKWSSSENDIEGQMNLEPAENHRLSVGGNVRVIRLDGDPISDSDIIIHGEPLDEQLAGLFLIDRWTLSDSLVLEGQIRGDSYSETQSDWSTRLTALQSIDEQKNHVLRFSFAKAYRSPLAGLRQVTTQRISLAPLGAPGYGFNVLMPSDDLDNEETWSLETGYKGRLADDTTLHIDGYYQRFTKMIGYRTVPDPLPLGRAYYQPDNINGADSYGVEVEIEKKTKAAVLSAWYAYNSFSTDETGQNIRSYEPANHKVGLNGRLFLTEGWTINANYRYTTTTDAGAGTTLAIGPSHRLDFGIAKDFSDGQGEVMVGVSDVLNETNGPNYGMGQLTAHETPGRVLFARMQFNF